MASRAVQPPTTPSRPGPATAATRDGRSWRITSGAPGVGPSAAAGSGPRGPGGGSPASAFAPGGGGSGEATTDPEGTASTAGSSTGTSTAGAGRAAATGPGPRSPNRDEPQPASAAARRARNAKRFMDSLERVRRPSFSLDAKVSGEGCRFLSGRRRATAKGSDKRGECGGAKRRRFPRRPFKLRLLLPRIVADAIGCGGRPS